MRRRPRTTDYRELCAGYTIGLQSQRFTVWHCLLSWALLAGHRDDVTLAELLRHVDVIIFDRRTDTIVYRTGPYVATEAENIAAQLYSTIQITGLDQVSARSDIDLAGYTRDRGWVAEGSTIRLNLAEVFDAPSTINASRCHTPVGADVAALPSQNCRRTAETCPSSIHQNSLHFGLYSLSDVDRCEGMGWSNGCVARM